MEKMFIYSDNLDSVRAGMGVNDAEGMTSRSAVVSYQCKVYRALLDQGRGLTGRKSETQNQNVAVEKFASA